MRIRIQPNKIFNKLLQAELKKTKKIAQKLKTMELVHIYLIKKKKITISNDFLAFFLCFSSNFSLLYPDPHIECGFGSRRENECGSMRTRIHSPGKMDILYLQMKAKLLESGNKRCHEKINL